MSAHKVLKSKLGLNIGVIWGVNLLLLALMGLIFGVGAPVITLLGGLYVGYNATVLGGIIGLILGFIHGYVLGIVSDFFMSFMH